METIQRTINILETFLKQPDIGISDLASLNGMNIATAHRIVSDLVKRGYLKQKQKRGKYSIGMKLLEFSSMIQSTLKIKEVALPFLQKLSQLTGEYSEVAILESYAAITVAQAEVSRNLRISNIIGERLPLHATSLGKLFLAYMEEDERKAFYLSQKLKPFTANTITDISCLEQEAIKIRRHGFSVDNEEWQVGVWSVAAPIYDFEKSVVGGLAIAAPSARVDDNRFQELLTLTRRYSRDTSREMGHKGD